MNANDYKRLQSKVNVLQRELYMSLHSMKRKMYVKWKIPFFPWLGNTIVRTQSKLGFQGLYIAFPKCGRTFSTRQSSGFASTQTDLTKHPKMGLDHKVNHRPFMTQIFGKKMHLIGKITNFTEKVTEVTT